MEIENMHPFCLPFSLCHDATSSSIVDENYGVKQTNQDNADAASNMNDDKTIADQKDTGSPNSDTTNRFGSESISQRPVITTSEEHMIASSLSDHSHDEFGLLDLDLDMKIEDDDRDDAFKLHNIDDDDICNGKNNDDWLPLSANHDDCLLFSSAGDGLSGSLSNNHHYLLHYHHHQSPLKMYVKDPSAPYSHTAFSIQHHQVFHNIVDSVDIKSSPTLAQLNLNSNEDPSDGLWDAASATATSTSSTLISPAAHHHHLHHHHLTNHHHTLSSSSNSDLLSTPNNNCNSSSTGAASIITGCSNMNLLSACNHLNHPNYNQHHGVPPTGASAALCATHPNSHSHSCQHHHASYLNNHHHYQQHQQQQQQHTITTGEQQQNANNSTCLAMTPFQLKSTLASQRSIPMQPANQGCCLNHSHQFSQDSDRFTSSPNFAAHSNITCRVDHKLNPSQRIQVLGQHHHQCGTGGEISSYQGKQAQQATSNVVQKGNQPSQQLTPQQRCRSPAPLVTSSSSPLSNSAIQQNPQQGEVRPGAGDNKLKENIEYLTVLLCNGSKKLDNKGQIQQQKIPPQTQPPSQPQTQPQATISSTMAKSYSTLAQTLSTGPKLLERYQDKHNTLQIHQQHHMAAMSLNNDSQQQPSAMPNQSTTAASVNVANCDPASRLAMQVDPHNSKRMCSNVESSISAADSTVSCGARWPARSYHNVSQTISQHVTNNVHVTISNNNNELPMDSTHGNIYGSHISSPMPVVGRPITLTPLVSNNVNIPPRQPVEAPVTTARHQQVDTKSKIVASESSLSSQDEGFSSQVDQDDCANSVRDSDDDSDIDSDDESFYGDYTNNDLIGASISDNPECKWTLNMGRTRRNGQKRFFWQYNVQSKGPKGTRVCSTDGAEDPFVLPEASDPVFSDECQIEGVKHSGKARRGDGNDLTPNPRKLLMIGLELKKLSKIINELAPVTDLPINARNKTRKEKNKLASRACRLKKKAQHEANKIKLYGLQREHQQVVMAIFDARKMIHKALTQQGPVFDNQLSANLKRKLDQCVMTVAGQTVDYVNSVLEKVVSGCIDGGLQT